MTNGHAVDEYGMITDLSKVANSDSVGCGGASRLVRAKKIRYGTSRMVVTDQSQREEDSSD